MTTSISTIESASRTMQDIEYLKIWFDFISNLVRYLAWPAFCIIIIFLIYFNREKIKNMPPEILSILKRINSISAAGISIGISDDLVKVDLMKKEIITTEKQNNSASTTNSTNTDFIRELFTPEDEFLKLVSLRPDYAVLNSFQTVEEYIRSFAETQNKSKSAILILREMMKNNTIPHKSAEYILSLSELRNKVVHNKNIKVSPDDAILYRENCVEAIQILAILGFYNNTQS
ncbi:hypothetical protein [Enterococcus sp. N249-2]